MTEVKGRPSSEPARAHVGSRRSDAGLLSLAANFSLGPGPRHDATAVVGYPIDMRVKAQDSRWPRRDVAPADMIVVEITQFGLGCYEHWLETRDERWLTAAHRCAEYLLAAQGSDGAWRHSRALPHTFDLRHGWVSAMAQGQGASLLVRLHRETRDERFAVAAMLALAPLTRSNRDGGVQADLDGGPWFEEYPTQPASYVLNGGVFALWGIRDVGVGLDDGTAQALFAQGLETLVASLGRFDTGWWSLYCLGALPVRNLASSFYHSLHIDQLEATHHMSARPELTSTADRWRRYARAWGHAPRLMAHKALFRVLVPRQRLIALPAARFWARRA